MSEFRYMNVLLPFYWWLGKEFGIRTPERTFISVDSYVKLGLLPTVLD